MTSFTLVCIRRNIIKVKGNTLIITLGARSYLFIVLVIPRVLDKICILEPLPLSDSEMWLWCGTATQPLRKER